MFSRILIVKTSALGDIVQAFFAVDRLKETFPEIAVDWVVESACSSLLKIYPHVDRILSVDTKEWRRKPFCSKTRKEISAYVKRVRSHEYGAVFDLQGNTKSGVLTAFARSKQKVGWGGASLAEWPNAIFTHRRIQSPPGLSAREENLFMLEAIFGKLKEEMPTRLPPLKKGACFLVAPGSRWENKKLGIEGWIGLLGRIAERLEGRFLFTWGTETEKLECLQISQQLPGCCEILEYCPILQLPALLNQVDSFLGVDSFLLHFAAYRGVPTYSIFGASSSSKYAPAGALHHSLQGSCPFGKIFDKRCPLLRSCPTGDCMKKLDPERVYQQLFASAH